MKIFYVDDIVEVITCKYSSWNDIPEHKKGYYENNREPAKTRGQRFVIRHISHDCHSFYGDVGGRLCLNSRPDQVILYKRPIKNWVKYLLKIKKDGVQLR